MRTILCIVLVLVGLAGPGICVGASIPAWLDDAISEWNAEKEHEDLPIRFVDIKDSFVWYMLAKNEAFGQKEIRGRVHDIVTANGYMVTDEEELVTTGKPPSPIDPHIPKKCWRRSYVLDINAMSNTRSTAGGQRAGQRQRMLTSMVCEDEGYWFMGFRIVQ